MIWPPLAHHSFRGNPIELESRLRQELANLFLLAVPPRFDGPAPTRLPLLPDPDAVCRSLTGSRFAADVIGLASGLVAHRVPLLGYTAEFGPEFHWRRDPIHG